MFFQKEEKNKTKEKKRQCVNGCGQSERAGPQGEEPPLSLAPPVWVGVAAIESAPCSCPAPSWDWLLGFGGGGGDRVVVGVEGEEGRGSSGV